MMTTRPGRRVLATITMLALVFAAGACGRGDPHKEPAAKEPTAPAAAPGAKTPAAADAAAAPAPGPKTPTSPADDVFAMPADDPGMWGSYCRADSECAWNDPCRPRACVDAKKAAKVPGCEESTLPPGKCRCVESTCTLEPTSVASRPASPETGCKADNQCAADPAAAICHVVANKEGGVIQGPLKEEGPYCTCDAKDARCKFQWQEPIACKSFRDCWYETSPRLRPIKSKKPRKKKIRPCKDGETDSVCADRPDGTKACRVVGWSC